MATATYVPIATQTLSSAASSISFSSIPQTYTDLRIVLTGITSSAAGICINTNNDAVNSGATWMYGNGSNTFSGSAANTYGRLSGNTATIASNMFLVTCDFLSYANTTTYKTYLSTFSGDANGSGSVNRGVGVELGTAAINQITIYPTSVNFNSGTTATLWGI